MWQHPHEPSVWDFAPWRHSALVLCFGNKIPRKHICGLWPDLPGGHIWKTSWPKMHHKACYLLVPSLIKDSISPHFLQLWLFASHSALVAVSTQGLPPTVHPLSRACLTFQKMVLWGFQFDWTLITHKRSSNRKKKKFRKGKKKYQSSSLSPQQ